ncbi:diacylglycerol kinase [Aeromicrobium panaciterrae]|uniref:NAD(P)H-dependent amine dehydrogenase family protein n=1 Tax=Aeromicrobium panaciterrae TaxID=363861 RepID=UPI0031E2DB3C
MTTRVAVWSTGTLGRHAIAGIDLNPELELVGVWVSNPDKDGKDAGRLAELGRDLGVLASADRDAVLAAKPDCIVYCSITEDRFFDAFEDLVGFLEAGINVVASGPVILVYPNPTLPDSMWERIEDAGQRGNASLHANGIDPGWANDIFPLQLASLSQRIDQVRVLEIADYSTYDQPVTMGDIFGFGKPIEEVAPLWQPGMLSSGWGPVVRQLAAGLGVTLDEPLVENVERLPAEADMSTVCVDIKKGTMAAVRFEVIGMVDGEPRIVVEHVTRTHVDQAPDWPKPASGDGSYRIEITGEPMMTVDFTHIGEHGDHNDSGMIITAQRLVNAVPVVVAASPGLVTALDLPLVTGRGIVGV